MIEVRQTAEFRKWWHGLRDRLYAVRRGELLIILLSGGDKSSQDRDIRKAGDMAKELE